MTIITILKDMTAAQKKAASIYLSAIRECEEIEPNVIVAFVDDGPVSHSLRLHTTPASTKIKSFTCDCGSSMSLCHHKLALLLNLRKGKMSTSVKRKIVRRKLSKAEKLLQTIDNDEKVLSWLTEKLNNDKVLRLELENALLKDQEILSADVLKSRFQEVLQTVKGRKAHATPQELPKLLELSKTVFGSAINFIYTNCEHKNVASMYKQLIDSAIQLAQTPRRPTSRIATLLKKIVAQAVPSIPNNQEYILKLLKHIIPENINVTELIDLMFPVLELYGPSLNKKKLSKLLAPYLNKLMMYQVNEKTLTTAVQIVSDLKLLDELGDRFRPLSYQHKYNLLLFEKLLEHNKIEKVMAYCHDVIMENAPKYQIPYHKLLIDTAIKIGDENKEFDFRMGRLNVFPNVEDYEKLHELDVSRARKDLLKEYSENIPVSSNYGAYAELVKMKFYYWSKEGLLDQVYKKLTTKQAIVACLPYMEELWEQNESLFIESLAKAFNKSYYSFWEVNHEIGPVLRFLRSKIKKSGGKSFLKKNPKINLAFLSIQEHE